MQSTASEETEKIAESMGARLRGGETIELVSDLGGGKTTFVRGLARGAGSKNHVSSPTFKISNYYSAPTFDIAHYDFYRLQEPGLIAYELMEAQQDPKNVIVVEWGEIVEDVLPGEKIIVRITSNADDSRSITVTMPTKFQYLAEESKE